jgi:hypothetical protein
LLNQQLVTTHIPSLQLNLDGLAHVQIMRATMPSASMYMQLNFIVKARASHIRYTSRIIPPTKAKPLRGMLLQIFIMKMVRSLEPPSKEPYEKKLDFERR